MTRGLIPRGCHIDYTVTYQRQPRADPIDNKTDPIDDKHYGRVCCGRIFPSCIFFFSLLKNIPNPSLRFMNTRRGCFEASPPTTVDSIDFVFAVVLLRQSLERKMEIRIFPRLFSAGR